jgi:cob(I)alamin adenosyltransferase
MRRGAEPRGDQLFSGQQVQRPLADRLRPDRLEDEIDAMNVGLKPLDSFVLPGGSPAAPSPTLSALSYATLYTVRC